MSLIVAKPDIQKFVLGGKAIFTVENRFSGGRFTYSVKQKKEGGIFWVSLLNGPDNTADYRFFGTIFPASGVDRFTHPPTFKHSGRAKIGGEAPSVRAWNWFFNRLFSFDKEFPLEFEFHHAGRCARCSRALTVPDSIRSGFGPECAAIVRGF